MYTELGIVFRWLWFLWSILIIVFLNVYKKMLKYVLKYSSFFVNLHPSITECRSLIILSVFLCLSPISSTLCVGQCSYVFHPYFWGFPMLLFVSLSLHSKIHLAHRQLIFAASSTMSLTVVRRLISVFLILSLSEILSMSCSIALWVVSVFIRRYTPLICKSYTFFLDLWG